MADPGRKDSSPRLLSGLRTDMTTRETSLWAGIQGPLLLL